MPLNPFVPATPGMTIRMILRAGGEFELLERRHSLGDLARMISDGEALTSVTIKRPVTIEVFPRFRVLPEAASDDPVPQPQRLVVPVGYVLLLRDTQGADLAYNAIATEVYWSQCDRTRDLPPMLGDAALVPDSDFGAVL